MPGALKPITPEGSAYYSPEEGDSLPSAIRALLSHSRLHPVDPTSTIAAATQPDNPLAGSHTASWGLRVDYVLPSRNLNLVGSSFFGLHPMTL